VTVEIEHLARDPDIISDLTGDAQGLAGNVQVLRHDTGDLALLEPGYDIAVERSFYLEALRPGVEVDFDDLSLPAPGSTRSA